jgi:hypothetical protein
VSAGFAMLLRGGAPSGSSLSAWLLCSHVVPNIPPHELIDEAVGESVQDW